ncbi:hypothetical protein MOQ33_00165 [Escherichia coli]|uniref:hypothetical protein n=3 Tax=Escherichia coli TaxID=562 RepID=UPI0021488941|nr:hypothetical protein [Escherichia coli]MCR1105698.1 hypothetical protein [Escherichia coli]MDT9424269.1 hypothetical protein [Escherichia coli]
MSIPVITPDHNEFGLATDYGVVEMRHGMLMAFPDEDIQTSDGSSVVTTEDQELVSFDVNEFVAAGEENVRLHEQLVTRGISRADVPELRMRLGDAFPKQLPDAFFTEIPSRNGVELVQEGFVAKVSKLFVDGAKKVWELIKRIWTFVFEFFKKTLQKIWKHYGGTNKFIATTDDIIQEVIDALGADYPRFKEMLDKEMTVNDVYNELAGYGSAINLKEIADKNLKEKAKYTAEWLMDTIPEVVIKFQQFSEMASSMSHNGNTFLNIVPHIAEIREFYDSVNRLWGVRRGTLEAIVPLVGKNVGVVAAADIVEEWVQKHQTELHDGSVIRNNKEAWVRELHDKMHELAEPFTAFNDIKFEKTLKEAEQIFKATKEMNPTADIRSGDIELYETHMKLSYQALFAFSRLISAMSRWLMDIQLAHIQVEQLVARYRAFELKNHFIILERDDDWKIIYQALKARAVKPLNDYKEKFDKAAAKQKEDAKTLDPAKKEMLAQMVVDFFKFESFEDDVSGCAYLTETDRQARKDLVEIDEAIYRTSHRGEVSKPDEQIYLELRERYMPDQALEPTMESFGIMKMAVIGVIITTAYTAIRRLLLWIIELLKKRADSVAATEKAANDAIKQAKRNANVYVPDENVRKEVDKTEDTDAMRNVVGAPSKSVSDVPLTTEQKLSAVSAIVDGIRKEMVTSPVFDRLQQACTSLTLGYFQEGKLDTILREMRRLRPDRIVYLNDQCKELEGALEDQKRAKEGEIAPRLANLAGTMKQGMEAYRMLYDNSLTFRFNELTTSAHLPPKDFAEFGEKVLQSGTPVYPDTNVLQQLATALDGNSYLLFTRSGDEFSKLADSKFKEIETQFRRLNDVARQVKAIPQENATELRSTVDYINAQIREIAAWYSFEEALRSRVDGLVTAYRDYVFAEAKLINEKLQKAGFGKLA